MSNDLSARTGRANGPYGELVVTALRKLGVQHFVVSPGSRSTPLTLAVAGLPENEATVCVDERSASFHALGRIKVSRRPVALICTSGTAGAHYYPAVIEAREAGLPLVVLTADRPPGRSGSVFRRSCWTACNRSGAPSRTSRSCPSCRRKP